MVINMVDVIKFKEPERCDYLYVDENNKVHILLPIVGGDEIGLDNTCQTAVELITFFYGSAHGGETKYSAEHQLSEYKRQLEEDIKAINSQKKISPHAYDDLLKEKKERLQQIEKYIELIQVLKKQYDEQNDIKQLRTGGIPQLPSGVKEIIKSSENAFAVRLSPYDNDKFTRFDAPLFNVKRNISKYDTPSRQAPIPIYEGLGYRLRSTLFPEDKTPTPINKKSLRDK
ncbi:TPA: protein SdcA, partial [Legionella pneumophila]